MLVDIVSYLTSRDTELSPEVVNKVKSELNAEGYTLRLPSHGETGLLMRCGSETASVNKLKEIARKLLK